MGVVGELSVTIRTHPDGCVIMSGTYDGQLVNIDYYERYASGTPVSRCLRALAGWCTQVENGQRDGEALWLELELPFDEAPPA